MVNRLLFGLDGWLSGSAVSVSREAVIVTPIELFREGGNSWEGIREY